MNIILRSISNDIVIKNVAQIVNSELKLEFYSTYNSFLTIEHDGVIFSGSDVSISKRDIGIFSISMEVDSINDDNI